MTDHLIIRPERPEDYAAVEQLTRAAFYNQYVPAAPSTIWCTFSGITRTFCPGWIWSPSGTASWRAA